MLDGGFPEGVHSHLQLISKTNLGCGGRRGLPFAGLWLLLLAAAGCVHLQPDLALLYHDRASHKEARPPLVGIHGLMGSEIVDPETGKVIWGRVRGLLSTTVDMRLALPIKPGEKTSLLAEVPASALSQAHTDLPYALAGFICEEHMKLVKNWTFRDNLLNFLLYERIPAAAVCSEPGP